MTVSAIRGEKENGTKEEGDDYESVMDKNSSEYSDDTGYGPGAHSLAYVESIQTLLTLITDKIFTIVCALGILANIVLLAYIIYYKRYKAPVFCVILSLGIADLGACLAGLLYFNFVSPFVQGPLWLCPAAAALMSLSYLSSTYHITVFAFLRFFQLVYPLASHAKVTTALMCKICLAIWSIHIIPAFVYGFYFETYNTSTTGTNALYACFFGGNRRARSLWIIIFWVLLPFITMSGLHVAKHVILVLSRSATVTSLDEQVRQVRRHTDSRALAAVIALYFLTGFPYLVQCFRIYVFSASDHPIEVYLIKFFIQVAFTNSAINPWLYLFAAESVRSEIRKMCTCNRKNGRNK